MNSASSLAIFEAMKLSTLVSTALAAISSAAFAQSIEVYPPQINFGFVDETAADSIEITLYNATPTACDIDVMLNRELYTDNAFRMNPSTLTVPGLDSAKAWIVFNPIHNIEYDGGIVLASNGPAGAVVLDVDAHGRYSNTYYNSTEGLNEEALKSAMNTLLAQNFNSLSYTAARDNMYATLDNVNGVVECVYTGRTATFSTRTGANNNNFNCEHTFPQGFFNQSQPMRADIHHLFPTDASTNSRRSNHPFGVVSNPTWTGGGSKYGSSVFEPRDAHKGACARAMLYFVIRYQDYTNFFAPQEAILKQWHDQFPPNAFEIGRNQGIYQLQNNRNPFVDYPQFVNRINDFVSNSTAEPVFDLGIVNDTLWLPRDANETHQVIFRTAVVNRGNQLVYVGPQAFTTEPITILNSTPQTLQPGEAMEIELAYPYDMDLSNFSQPALELQTNLPSGNVTLYLVSEDFDLSATNPTAQDIIRPYPNPTSEVLHFDERTTKVSVWDMNGRLVAEGETSILNVSELPSGSYQVEYYIEGAHRETIQILRD